MKYICPCCGYLTFDYPDDWKNYYQGNKFPHEYAQYACGFSLDSCPICAWDDDSLFINSTIETGSNPPLSISQKNFKRFGSSRGPDNQFSRKPTSSDVFIGPLCKFSDSEN